MEVLYEICAGLDVHARTVVACLIRQGRKTIRTFGTMTEDLLRLLEWLKAEGWTHVAIESTGVYWKPVFNILEGSKLAESGNIKLAQVASRPLGASGRAILQQLALGEADTEN